MTKELTVEQAQQEVEKLQRKRAKELRTSLKQVKTKFVLETLGIPQSTFTLRKVDGKFTTEQAEILLKRGWIKK